MLHTLIINRKVIKLNDIRVGRRTWKTILHNKINKHKLLNMELSLYNLQVAKLKSVY